VYTELEKQIIHLIHRHPIHIEPIRRITTWIKQGRDLLMLDGSSGLRESKVYTELAKQIIHLIHRHPIHIEPIRGITRFCYAAYNSPSSTDLSTVLSDPLLLR
jgi:hypothetical protein